MRKNKIEGKIENSGRKKELQEPIVVTFKVEKEKLKDVRKRYGNGLNRVLRDFLHKL